MSTFLLAVLATVGLLIALPIITYFCVKLGTYAHLRAKQLFNERGNTNGKD